MGMRTVIVLSSLFIFSFLNAQAPGSINTGLKIWLDAGTNVSATGTKVTSWGYRNNLNTVTQANVDR